ncbi:hypothetical protein PIB30_083162 [Stylosanthes scabra]|uniref:Uncharacterized protein n=1 Tax=Stylosanthes scabra TaxID=79078 RepID=A0ABU6SUC9_9FABA|nr:hypothetical protein [Stylosanthes scabra]
MLGKVPPSAVSQASRGGPSSLKLRRAVSSSEELYPRQPDKNIGAHREADLNDPHIFSSFYFLSLSFAEIE